MTEIQARPTLYKGIQMRSRLEADFARYLDSLGTPWAYEPSCFADETAQWLPDFRTSLPTTSGGSRTVYIELKPAGLLGKKRFTASADAFLTRMRVTWASEPDAMLYLVYWSYGANGPRFGVLGTREQPWRMWDGESDIAIWPGMGQLEQVP